MKCQPKLHEDNEHSPSCDVQRKTANVGFGALQKLESQIEKSLGKASKTSRRKAPQPAPLSAPLSIVEWAAQQSCALHRFASLCACIALASLNTARSFSSRASEILRNWRRIFFTTFCRILSYIQVLSDAAQNMSRQSVYHALSYWKNILTGEDGSSERLSLRTSLASRIPNSHPCRAAVYAARKTTFP